MSNSDAKQSSIAGNELGQAQSDQDADLVRRIRNRLVSRFYELGNIEADKVKSMLREAASTIERLSAPKPQATHQAPFEPIYQVYSPGSGGWGDTTRYHFDLAPQDKRRIVFLASDNLKT